MEGVKAEDAEVEENQGDQNEEEGDWEWEYYSEDEEDQEEEDLDASKRQKRQEEDARMPWIIQGLRQIVPVIPIKSGTRKSGSFDTESDYEVGDELLNAADEEDDPDRGKGYKEWLEESAELHDAHVHIEAELDHEEEDEEVNESSKEGTPLRQSKAQKLVEKIRNSQGIDLKRVLFSLKTFFQSDKDLVFEFIKEQGLSLLIELGEDQEAQLQNLILRALGQIMLYVDGMSGVMENPKAVQFLYKLMSCSNPLVCKTATKLLLVFVEYAEANCTKLVQAINDVDKELGVIPWSDTMGVVSRSVNCQEKRSPIDTELAMYAVTLINKSLYGIPDQDTFYDQVR